MRTFLDGCAGSPSLGRGGAGLHAWQTEKTRGALAHRALHLECAPMPTGDLRGDGETQPRAAGLARPVSLDPVKALEEVWEMLRRDAWSGVAHRHPDRGDLLDRAHRHRTAGGRVLDGVVKDIQE